MMRASFFFCFVWALGLAPAQAAVKGSPEQQTLEIAHSLTPVSDETWAQISGTVANQKYPISAGDTLFDISKRLFGDARYWPKIWALNNDTIMNPHLIMPGNQITFVPGSGVSLPQISVESSSSAANSTNESDEGAPSGVAQALPPKGHPSEWRRLPEQHWEFAARFRKSAPADTISLRQSLSKNYASSVSMERPYEISTRPQDLLGEIIQAPRANQYFGTGEQVVIRPSGTLVPGTSYTIVRGCQLLKDTSDSEADSKNEKIESADKSGDARETCVYRNLGTVEVVRQIGTTWLGQISTARDVIYRGDKILPIFPRLTLLTPPLPGAAPITGKFYTDPDVDAARLVAMGQYGFVNLGAKDGVKEGMLFQSYQTIDPSTGLPVPLDDIFPRVTLEVIQTSDTFSCVALIAGRTVAGPDDLVKLLTDVSAFGGGSTPQPAPSASALPEPQAAPSAEPMPAPSELPIVAPVPNLEPTPAPSADALPEPPSEALPSPEGDLAPKAPGQVDEDEKLGAGEERELKQLENHKPNESLLPPQTQTVAPEPTPAAAPETAPAPEPTAAVTPEPTTPGMAAPEPTATAAMTPVPVEVPTAPPVDPKSKVTGKSGQ